MKYPKQFLLWTSAISLILPTAGFTVDEYIADETPSYTNAAQAMHASNLADAAAMNPDSVTEVIAADLRAARQDYEDAAEEDKDLAFDNLETARQNYADEIERLTGEASENIYAMRDDGMGWGQIANELGVHPGTLGLGHTKKNRVDPLAIDDGDYQNSDNEIAKATKRDTKQGWSKKHTTTTESIKNNKKSVGLSAGQSKNISKGTDKNNSTSKNHNGKSQSSKSNNGTSNNKNK